jgi:hypothetical protein
MFLIINQGSLTFSEKELSLELMQNLVGIEGEHSYIEFLRGQFSDPNIDLVLDDESKLKPYCFQTCITPKDKIILQGQVIAVGFKDGKTIGLSPSQLETVCNELKIIFKQSCILTSSQALHFFH